MLKPHFVNHALAQAHENTKTCEDSGTHKNMRPLYCLIQQSVSTEEEFRDIVEEYFAVSWTELKLILIYLGGHRNLANALPNRGMHTEQYALSQSINRI